jgi:hypothetical protein
MSILDGCTCKVDGRDKCESHRSGGTAWRYLSNRSVRGMCIDSRAANTVVMTDGTVITLPTGRQN